MVKYWRGGGGGTCLPSLDFIHFYSSTPPFSIFTCGWPHHQLLPFACCVPSDFSLVRLEYSSQASSLRLSAFSSQNSFWRNPKGSRLAIAPLRRNLEDSWAFFSDEIPRTQRGSMWHGLKFFGKILWLWKPQDLCSQMRAQTLNFSPYRFSQISKFYTWTLGLSIGFLN